MEGREWGRVMKEVRCEEVKGEGRKDRGRELDRIKGGGWVEERGGNRKLV
jgi:hypothetical protein